MLLPNPRAKFKAVKARHHHVQNRQVDGGVSLNLLPGLQRIIKCQRLIALAFYDHFHQIGDFFFVVHDQDCHAITLSAASHLSV